MSFSKKIAVYVGQSIQVETAVETFAGELVSADDTFTVINRDGVKDSRVTILTDAISYVRRSL
ncbi:hypothetical protein A8L34_17050 [Bacillus sp. FJAT-27264]|uniref:hypothetical protein n=1 Tax=Paenibacillus sp. (strain DSM 101736 / FJAT-27264) TaxID=1850362 RepID=UPI000807F228|nr:hypothetical protein [Bacillus sp. FJAT-27264]OBZ12018.1 hypothetical protein A8L34_17050 [Bacillus sp. FJAT-27264]